MDIVFDAAEIQSGGFSIRADATLPGGQITALIGPSGAGKSTLLGAIAGFADVAKGRLLLGGRNMAGIAPVMRPVSLVFQDHNLFEHMTVEANVALGLGADPRLKGPARAEKRAAVAQALARVGLAERANALPGQLSGGERSRAALARALLRDRPVLLLDEPFAALGPGLRYAMLDLVAEISAERGLTTLLVTHQPDDAARIAAQTALVDAGRLSAPQDTRSLLGNPPPALAAYLGQK
ncbi:thiamine ABC transporter ATP-binding protein [Abyssibius alkaniclasticus]|uniref:thiamine ABC transporter ATP-binding protein n=1 Tax=Abyssibius alkaniclasticus TaxID=2881234 RepID=UPI0040584EE5